MTLKIYAYVDRSRFAESVWQHAVWAANQLNAPVEIIHVLDQPVSIETSDYSGYQVLDNPQAALEERVRLDELQNKILIEEGRQLLDAIADRVRDAGVTRVSQRLFQGTLLEHLREHAGDCLLAIIGKRGEAADQDPQHLGRNVERLVRSAHRPVLVTAPEFTPIERAMIAWDGGESSGKAIHLLASRPLLHGVPTTIVHVTDRPENLTKSLGDAREHLESSGMEASTIGIKGDVSDAILESARELNANLLVIGAYGHSRIRHLVIGSTTTEILMRSEPSVLIFH